MPTYVALLRDVNAGPRNRLAMSDVRDLLTDLGYGNVRSYLQNGNLVFSSPARLGSVVAEEIERAIREELKLRLRVLIRTSAQLDEIVALDPLAELATDPHRYVVLFCERRVPLSVLDGIEREAFAPEVVELRGSELYLWLPDGLRDSRLLHVFTEHRLGGAATSRDWSTVLALRSLAGT